MKPWHGCVLFACLFVFALTCFLSLRHKDIAYDEPAHYSYGERILQHDPQRSDPFDNSKMPFAALNVLGSQAMAHIYPIDDPIKAGRWVTIVAALILGFYVFQWGRALYGIVPGLFALLLFCLDPTVIAYARLVGTDLYAALAITVSCYYFWRFAKYGGWRRGGVSAFVLAVGQIAKYTSLPLYLLFFVIALIKGGRACYGFYQRRQYMDIRRLVVRYLGYMVLFIAAGMLIINIGFGFVKTGTPLKEYAFVGSVFKKMQANPVLKEMRIPLPYAYLQGLDMLQSCDATGETVGNIYLLGHLKEKEKGDVTGFPGYYFIAYLLKVPLAAQLIILLSFFYFWRYRRENFFSDEIFIVLPLIFFGIYFNFFVNMQIGIRSILFFFPLLYVFTGNLFMHWPQFKPWLKGSLVVLLVYLAVSVFSYAPHFISYFNEIVWDRKQAYQYLADSNIQFNGDDWYVEQYMKKHPGVMVNPDAPTVGTMLVTVNELVGVRHPRKFEWVRDNLKPVDQIAYMFLVYEVTPQDLIRLHLKYKD